MNYTIPIVEKTFRVLTAIGANGGATSMQQLSRSLNIAPSSCFRIIRTLQDQGWIAERRTGGWELSVGLVRLMDGLAPTHRLIDAASAPLSALIERVGMSGKVSVRQADQAVTVWRGESPAAISITGRVGAAYSLVMGSSGASLCSDMTDAQIDQLICRSPESAWAHQCHADFLSRVSLARNGRCVVDRGSYSSNIHTVSASIRHPHGEVIGAITLIAMAGDLTAKLLPRISREIVACAREIEAALSPAGTGGLQ